MKHIFWFIISILILCILAALNNVILTGSVVTGARLVPTVQIVTATPHVYSFEERVAACVDFYNGQYDTEQCRNYVITLGN